MRNFLWTGLEVLKNRIGNDPRSIARDIPGFFDVLFPHLTSGLVASFNRNFTRSDACVELVASLVEATSLQRSMLFELAVEIANAKLAGREEPDWNQCLSSAVKNQRQYFDAVIPTNLSANDKKVALLVGANLHRMLIELCATQGLPLTYAPLIRGLLWIASGNGDYAIGSTIVEVKCSNRNFSMSDYRQLIMYWLLSYAAELEKKQNEWTHGVLMNPRLNKIVSFSFDDVVESSAGRSKVEILELLKTLLTDSKNA